MGDSGEGLVDNEARIQERIEELRQNRENASKPVIENPELRRQLESLQLARTELTHQLESTTHQARKVQLIAALTDIDRRIADIEKSEER